ncbi:MAG TPA: TonB-dependent receptor plug domain-containing protein [Puia sp.]
MDGNPLLSIHVCNITVDSLFHLPCLLALKICFRLIDDQTLSLLRTEPVRVGQVRVSDDQNDFPLNASVFIRQGSDSVTWSTDDSGRLFFAVQPEPFFIRITHVGYLPVEIGPQDSTFQIGVVLKPAINDLDKATVNGYGTMTPRESTGSPAGVTLPESEKMSTDNVLDGLEGRVAGLSITTTTGASGGNKTIRIRGRNSIAESNSPLLLFDGIPINLGNPGAAGTNNASAQGFAGFSPLYPLLMNMIGDVAVLKDASSTSIYGSRGANGVIVVNTSVDTAGNERWTLGADRGTARIVPIQSPLSIRDFLALRRTALVNDGSTVDTNTMPELLWDTTRDGHYKRTLIGNPGLQLDLNGGFREKDKGGYLVLNGFFHRETSVFLGQPADNRISLSAHFLRHPLGHHYTLQGSILYTLDNLNLPANDLTNYIDLTPNTPSPYNNSGQLVFNPDGVGSTNYRALAQNVFNALTHSLYAHSQWTDTLGRGLLFKLSGGLSSARVAERTSLPASAQDPATSPFSIDNINRTSNSTVVAEPMMEYGRKIHSADSVNVLLGCSWEEQYSLLSSLVSEYGSNAPMNTNAGSGSPDNRLVYRYEAIFGRVHTVHDRRYIVDLSFRRDGSSRFGPGRQFGNFGAVGVGWVFSRTRLLKTSRSLSFGKLRASYGTVGSDQIGDYQYLSLYNPAASGAGYLGAPSLSPATAYNPNLGWEIQHQFEGGLDLGLLNNRVLLSASYYYHWSGNELVLTNPSSQTGVAAVMANIAARVQNSGLEIVLTAHLLNTRHWQWTMSGTLSLPENKLVSFPGLATSTYANTFIIGKPLTELTGYRYTSVKPDSGLFTFLEKQGSKVVEDIGNMEVRYFAGLGNSIVFRRFFLDIFGEFRKQNGLSAITQLYGINPPGMADLLSGLSNQLIKPAWYWKNPGDHSLLQKPTATTGTAAWSTINDFVNSSAQVTDASFFRLNTVSFGYILPRQILRRFGCKEGKVTVEAKNILTITHYLIGDPETQSINSLPPLKVIRCSLHFKF